MSPAFWPLLVETTNVKVLDVGRCYKAFLAKRLSIFGQQTELHYSEAAQVGLAFDMMTNVLCALLWMLLGESFKYAAKMKRQPYHTPEAQIDWPSPSRPFPSSRPSWPNLQI